MIALLWWGDVHPRAAEPANRYHWRRGKPGKAKSYSDSAFSKSGVCGETDRRHVLCEAVTSTKIGKTRTQSVHTQYAGAVEHG